MGECSGSLFFLVTLLILHSTVVAESISVRSTCEYPAIFSFGDSLTDTGNRAISPDLARSYCIDPPYGMTYFRQPTGRCSDGRLMIDFIAQNMGLPQLPPYMMVTEHQQQWPLIQHGVNFAVAGSTALNASFFELRGIETQTDRSLGVQVNWFKTLLPTLCPNGTENCNLLTRSLFLVGEIGGNDLNYLFLNGNKSADEVRALFPRIIQAISEAVQDLIHSGARALLVPGNFPLGCNVAYRRLFPAPPVSDGGGDEAYYDPDSGCIRWLNQLAEDFNWLLQKELDRLRRSQPQVAIMYADYYGAALRIFLNPARYGFIYTFKACCGSYNAMTLETLKCGDPGTRRPCKDPSRYVSWDGMHMTEAVYRLISSSLLDGTFIIPTSSKLCLPNLARLYVPNSNNAPFHPYR